MCDPLSLPPWHGFVRAPMIHDFAKSGFEALLCRADFSYFCAHKSARSPLGATGRRWRSWAVLEFTTEVPSAPRQAGMGGGGWRGRGMERARGLRAGASAPMGPARDVPPSHTNSRWNTGVALPPIAALGDRCLGHNRPSRIERAERYRPGTSLTVFGDMVDTERGMMWDLEGGPVCRGKRGRSCGSVGISWRWPAWPGRACRAWPHARGWRAERAGAAIARRLACPLNAASAPPGRRDSVTRFSSRRRRW